jgi:hypothetical protein
VTDAGGHCSFCGATSGPFAKVEGLFTVLICIPCLEVRQTQPDTHLGLHDPSPYPAMTRAQMRESLELLPSWVLAQKAAANRQAVASCVSGWRLASRWPGCIGSRAWPGWRAKLRLPSSYSPSGKPASRTRTCGSAAGAGRRQASLNRPGPMRAALADSRASSAVRRHRTRRRWGCRVRAG